LTVFGGITDRLIPLFAVGTFMAFTLSQLGMAVHWLQQKGNRIRLLINGTGAAGTGSALAVILAAKFIEGAWITVLVIPCVLVLLRTINRYHEMIDRQLRDGGPIALDGLQPPIAVLPLQRWDRLADKAVRYSLLISPEVIAIHLAKLEGPGPLFIAPARDRTTVAPSPARRQAPTGSPPHRSGPRNARRSAGHLPSNATARSSPACPSHYAAV
jgi:hypothetical protein